MKSEPEVNPSDSHVIPVALGGGIELKNAVCENCNGKFNREVETPIKDNFKVLRNWLMIRNRRGEISSFKGEGIFGDLKSQVVIDGDFKMKDICRIFTDKSGKKRLFIPEEEIEEYKKKHPEAKLEEDLEDFCCIESDIDFGICAELKGLRLAAKVAFEWLCCKRGVPFVLHEEFNEIRNYIQTGSSDRKLVSIVTDEQILKAYENILFGNHCIILSPTIDRKKIALFGLWGVLFYKVILRDNDPIISKKQEVVIVNSQRQDEYEPPFQKFHLPLKAIDNDYNQDSKKALKNIFPHINQRIIDDMEKIKQMQ